MKANRKKFWEDLRPGDLIKDKKLTKEFSRVVLKIEFAKFPEDSDQLVVMDQTGRKYYYNWYRIENHLKDYEILSKASR